MTIKLPKANGALEPYILREPPLLAKPRKLESRTVYAAAHVVADPLGENCLGAPAALDWESTLAFRHHLWALGLGVAEAMDTAQRGMGLNWTTTQELIRRSAAAAKLALYPIACGAGTDQLSDRRRYPLHEIVAAYLEQCEVVETAGAKAILMASRALAASANHSDDYEQVYDSILTKVSRPVIIHWLGPMFDPALEGYWGSLDLDQAAVICLKIIEEHVEKIDGIKVSLLDKEREVTLTWEENQRAVEEAAAVGAEVLVLVCGGMVNHDLDRSREMVVRGIDRLLPYSEKNGVKLGIEPLHPMFAADRSVIVSLNQAYAIVDMFKSSSLGTVIDVYHVWWDPVVYSEIARAAGHIFGFHVNDWIVPVPDMLNGRGMMGDGVIAIKRLRDAVTEAGYGGPIEVEVFNEELWRLPGSEILGLVKDRFLKVV